MRSALVLNEGTLAQSFTHDGENRQVTATTDSGFKGAPSSVSNTASSTSYTYDGFGRISGSIQTTGTGTNPPSYTFAYCYSLTDTLTSTTYPSGRQVSYTLNAGDQVTAVQNIVPAVGCSTPASGVNYASSISYTADGGLSVLALGNTVTESYTWNDRFQPTQMAASTPSTALLTLGFFPCQTQVPSCSTSNNGNLYGQTIQFPTVNAAPALSVTQTYSYDHLNRLTNAQESGGGTPWSQTYNYDAFGNRWIAQGNSTGLLGLTNETPTAQSSYSTTVPNRIAGWSYDANDNVLNEGAVARSFTYDGENNQVTATVGSGTSTYVYDGLGQRVSKTVSGQTTTYVYDAFGNFAAEYGGESNGCGTCYVTTDHLGSTRLLTNSAGGIFARYGYEPFGQEIPANYDGRTVPMGYTSAPDAGNPKFTGQQRDQETTLDWFNVRYYSSDQGRFQSPDPGNAGADPSNPQSWNGYAYVNNNPLSYTDPSGMFVEDPYCADPVSCGIAAAVAAFDLGELLADVFGGGAPSSIPPSLATPSSPIMGPTFSVTGWGTADTVAPSWSAVGGVLPVIIPGLTFYAETTLKAASKPFVHQSPCHITDPVLGALEFKLKFRPEVEAGPVKLGFSLYKNLTTGGSGGIMEANAGLLGIQGDYQTPTGGAINGGSFEDVQKSASFLGFQYDFRSRQVKFNPSKTFSLGLQALVGFDVSLNPDTVKQLGISNRTCEAQGGH